MSTNNGSSARTRLIAVMIAAFTLTLVVLTVGYSLPNSARDLKKSVSHEPERLTELYVADPEQVPHAYSLDAPLVVRFTVHNLEYRDMTYSYRITCGQYSAVKTLSLKDGAYQNVQESIPAGEYGEREQVIISLVGRPESIHFWVERR